ncbi:MAG: type I-B CRISPR-associated protein Cas5b [Myxococcota bacterium]
MPVLRLKIYQPQAHYRIPFTYQRRLTYPIPPYSTIIGFLCNASGVDDQNIDLYQNVIRKLKISIAGRFKAKNTEMIWFRNLSKDAHKETYRSIDNREKNGYVGHIGGQSPIKIDVLEDVELIIYIYHENKEKLPTLQELQKNLENPKNRLQVLHLGRAEDWIVYREIEIIEDSKLKKKRMDGNYPYFFWIPERIFTLNNHSLNWDNFDGLFYRLTTFSNIEGYEQHYNHTGKRIYQTINAKLNDGKIINTECLFDTEINLPVFFSDFENNGVQI